VPMPYLDVDQLNGPHANLYLFTVMLAPSAPAIWRRLFERFVGHADYVAVSQFRSLIEERHSAGLRDFLTKGAHRQLDQMMISASPIDATAASIQSDWRQGLEDGRFTGQVLLYCLERGEGQEAAFRYFRTMSARGQSRSHQSNRWHRARRAAHFWAQGLRAPIPSPYGDNSMRQFRSWLAAAERLRRQAERFVPTRRDGPLLNPFESWRIPKGLKK
jgi:hypothetical protein